jgi:hypothetical protein
MIAEQDDYECKSINVDESNYGTHKSSTPAYRQAGNEDE